MNDVLKLQEKYKKAIELGFSFSKIQMSLINNDTDKIVVLNREKRIVFFNESYDNLFIHLFPKNKSRPELDKKFKVSSQKEIWDLAIDKAFKGEHSRFFYSYVLDGEIFNDIISISPIKNENKTITGCAIFGKSQSKEIQNNTSTINPPTSNPELVNLYKSSSLAIITSLGYGMYYCNEKFEKLTGYTKDEINTRGISVIFHPDELEETMHLMLQLQSGEIDSFNMRRRYIRKDGKEIWASVSLATIKDEKGEVISHIVLAKEISEEQKIEQAFRDSEVRFKQLFDFSPFAILIREIETNTYSQANQVFYDLFGYAPDELKKLSRHDLTVHDDSEKIEPFIEKLYTKELDSFKIDNRFKKKNGEEFSAIVTRSLVKLGNNEYIMGIIEDSSKQLKMEFALKESEAKMRSMFMGTKDKFIAVDRNYRLLYFNASAAEHLPSLFELKKLEEGVEMLPTKNLHLREMWINHFERGLSGEIFELEKKYPIGKKDRTDIVAFSPIHNPLGEIIGVTLIGKEVTNLINIQEALKISEAKLQEAHSLAKLGSWEYDLIKKTFIGSSETQKLLKLPTNHPPLNEKLFYGKIHPEDQEELAKQSEDVLTLHTNLNINLRVYNFENELLNIHATGKPYLEDGKVVKVFGTILDITAQKQAELSLYEKSEEYKELFENMYDAVVITDSSGKMIDANKAAEVMLGYSREELKEIFISDIVYHEDREISKKYLNLLMTNGFYSGYQGRIVRKDGEIVYIQVNSNATYDKLGNITGSRDIVRNISDLKKAEFKREQLLEELAEVNNELKEFAHIVSHDLKAPLRHIKSISNWLNQDYSDLIGEDGKKQLELLNNRVTRMHHFINGIFEYTKLGRIKHQRELININEIIASAIEFLNIEQHIKIEMPDNFPLILGEKIKIEQVFQNLISNAIKYNDKPNPLIKISYKDQNTHHCFSISDNGKGIDKRNYAKIFQIFQTLQPKDSFESTGIGLTIVKRIIRQQGGKVNVKSVVGIGTTFEFTLEK